MTPTPLEPCLCLLLESGLDSGQGWMRVDGQPALRVSGIFKMGPVSDEGSTTDPLGLK